MNDIKNLVKCLNDKAQGEIFWLGDCDESQIKILEIKLKLSLPDEF